MLITSDVDGGSYELYVVPKDASGRSDSSVRAPCHPVYYYRPTAWVA